MKQWTDAEICFFSVVEGARRHGADLWITVIDDDGRRRMFPYGMGVSSSGELRAVFWLYRAGGGYLIDMGLSSIEHLEYCTEAREEDLRRPTDVELLERFLVSSYRYQLLRSFMSLPGSERPKYSPDLTWYLRFSFDAAGARVDPLDMKVNDVEALVKPVHAEYGTPKPRLFAPILDDPQE